MREKRKNIEKTLSEVAERYAQTLLAMDDDYLRERAIDMKDVGERLLRHLLGIKPPSQEVGPHPYILVGEEVTPSELIAFARAKLVGICLDSGGATSHVAILAGAMGIPAVFGLSNLSRLAETGNWLLVDSRAKGLVVLNPTTEEREAATRAAARPVIDLAGIPAQTADQAPITLAANISRLEELPQLARLGIKRIGLFRSEFMFMEGADFPTESFQEEVYRQVVAAAPDSAVLRTLDIGSDKPLKYLPLPKEANPAMGWRSVRFSLHRPELLLIQLRAMIRSASAGGRLRVIFPMVSHPGELPQLADIWQRALDAVGPARAPEWGIMVEVPSALFMMDAIARHTKYISIGTNDLMQFVFGADRTNDRVAPLLDPLSMPFVRLLRALIAGAHAEGITVGLCGEMAGTPEGFITLLGLGLDEFSMKPTSLAQIKPLLPTLSKAAAATLIDEALAATTDLSLRERLTTAFPEVFRRADP